MSDVARIVTEQSWREPDEELRAQFGIWVFLASEILFFGGLFLAYAVARTQNPVGFLEAGRHTSFFYGTLNTVILLTSSFAVAVAVSAHKRSDIGLVRPMLLTTVLLGTAFLVVKGFEYRQDVVEHLVPGPDFALHLPSTQAFFAFYWVMTGLHAVHVIAGLGIVGRVWVIARRDPLAAGFPRTLEVSALYWHLIDVIWVMLYPIFYLVGRTP